MAETNRVLEIGRGHGFIELLHTNINGDGQHVIATSVDSDVVKDELLPHCKMLADDHQLSKDMYPVRIIPQHVLDQSFREGWFNDKAAWKRWANSEAGRLFGIERKGKVPTV